MIEYREHPEGYVELTIDGKIDRQGFEDLVAKLGPSLDARSGKTGVLKHIVSFGGIEPEVLWDDLKFGFRHLKQVGPVAVVSDKKWIEVWTKLAAPFWSSEVRFFEPGQLARARQWLAGAMERSPSAPTAE